MSSMYDLGRELGEAFRDEVRQSVIEEIVEHGLCSSIGYTQNSKVIIFCVVSGLCGVILTLVYPKLVSIYKKLWDAGSL